MGLRRGGLGWMCGNGNGNGNGWRATYFCNNNELERPRESEGRRRRRRQGDRETQITEMKIEKCMLFCFFHIISGEETDTNIHICFQYIYENGTVRPLKN